MTNDVVRYLRDHLMYTWTQFRLVELQWLSQEMTKNTRSGKLLWKAKSSGSEKKSGEMYGSPLIPLSLSSEAINKSYHRITHRVGLNTVLKFITWVSHRAYTRLAYDSKRKQISVKWSNSWYYSIFLAYWAQATIKSCKMLRKNESWTSLGFLPTVCWTWFAMFFYKGHKKMLFFISFS